MFANRRVRALSVLVLACALVFSLAPTVAFAATKKVTVKYSKYTTTIASADKTAKTVKRGTTKLTFKKSSGFLKFTPTKSGYYKFTISNVKGGKKRTSAYFEIMKESQSESLGKSLSPMFAKTKGGTNSRLFLGANGHTKKSYTDKTYSELSSRTGKVRLEEGQTVYIYFGNGNKAKTTATLTIK